MWATILLLFLLLHLLLIAFIFAHLLAQLCPFCRRNLRSRRQSGSVGKVEAESVAARRSMAAPPVQRTPRREALEVSHIDVTKRGSNKSLQGAEKEDSAETSSSRSGRRRARQLGESRTGFRKANTTHLHTY